MDKILITGLKVVALITTGIVILFFLKIDRQTKKLRKYLKTGDHVRFYIGEISYTGKVDIVYYRGTQKMARIHYPIDRFTERPVSEIYSTLL